jgi:hypothetical protein
MSNDSERLNRARRLGVGIVAAIGFILTMTMFTPAVRADPGEQSLQVCANGSLDNLGEECGEISSAPNWLPDGIDPNVWNSRYREGDGVPYRFAIAGLGEGEHTLTITYDFTIGGRFATDRLTRYDLTQKADPCADSPLVACTYGNPKDSSWEMPGDVASPGSPGSDVPPLPNGGNLYTFTDSGFTPGHLDDITGSRLMTAWEGSGTTFAWVSMDTEVMQSGVASGDSSRSFSLTFEVSGGCDNDCSVMLGWTAHLASSESDSNGGWGAGQGASSIPTNDVALRMVVESIEYGSTYRDLWSCAVAPGELIVIKKVVGGGPYPNPSDFTITVTGQNPSPSSFQGAESPGTSVALDLGDYEVIESDSRGYTLSYDGDCSGTIAQGDIKYCTVINTWIFEIPHVGEIIITKNAVGGDDRFTFSTSGGDGFPPSFSIATVDGTGTENFPGINTDLIYSVTENPIANWALQSVDCVDSYGVSWPNLAFEVPDGGYVECTFVNVRTDIPTGMVTDTSLCTFDRDPDLEDSQFRLLFTPDPSNQPYYKVTTTNPGQFYYNVFYSGAPGTVILYINVPFPFVTHGARPIHAYSSVEYKTVNGFTCLIPGTEIYSSTQAIVLDSFTPKDFGGFATLMVTFTNPNPGTFVYLNMHLEYGLKASGGWTKHILGGSCPITSNYATGPAPWDPLTTLTICDQTDYSFSVSALAGTPPWDDTQAIQNQNVFKHDPGIAGLITNKVTLDGIADVKVEIYNPKKVLIGTVYTDSDGYYSFVWKHTGKSAYYTVMLPEQKLSKNVLVKANTFVYVNFQI